MSRAIQSILSYNTSSYRWFHKLLSRTIKTNKRKLESTETTLKKAFRMLSSVGKNGRLETPKGTKGRQISRHRKPLNIKIASHLEENRDRSATK